MAFKSLILGLMMSMGAFALKSGAGMGYLLADGQKWTVQAGRTLMFAAGYGVVFLVSWTILSHVDLTAHLDKFTLLFKSGMTLHLLLAVLVMIWGAGLLTSTGEKIDTLKKTGGSKVWMALAIPCPVCFTVILLSSGFLTALYPDQGGVLVWLYFGFVLSALSAAFLVARTSRGRAETVLGTLMIYISGYFILSVVLIPQWADLGRIYRISLSDSSVVSGSYPAWTTLFILTLAALCLGFFRASKKESI